MSSTARISPPAASREDRGPLLDPVARESLAKVGAFVVFGVVVGTAAIVSPVIAVAVAGLVLAIAWLVARRGRPTGIFLGALAGLLIGYAFLGRGLAHVGLPPLYVGEMVLSIGVLAAIVAIPTWRGGAIRILIVLFMVWGMARTLPYVDRYGIDALRDAVTWAYAIFALLVSALLHPSGFLRVVGLYRTIAPFYLLWIPLAVLVTSVVTFPNGPGSEVPIINFKMGDVGVQLAGIAAFALVGLYASTDERPRVPEWLLWALWIPAAVAVIIYSRGGFAALAMAGAALLFVRVPRRWFAPILVGTAALVAVVAINPQVQLGTGRTISVGQFVDNVVSIVAESPDAGLEGTKEFRLAWWGDIIDYTVNGPYFWTGKGFGVNLADDDGFQVTADHSLRAPHNGHLEILARTGVPGFLLWVALNAAIAFGLILAASRAKDLGRTWWAAVDGWLFVFWAAVTVNSSFDPYLQGPQGGIWFWVMVGLSIVAVEASGRPVGRDEDDGIPIALEDARAGAG